MKQAEFFFDFGSPASYLAATQMDAIAARTGATIVWRPFLLGAVFKATGNHSPAVVPAKSVWMNRDLERFAARYGAPFRFNPHFPINTLTLMRAAAAMDLQGALRPFADAVYRAMWVDGVNLNDPTAAAGALQAAGFDPAAVLSAAESQQAKDRLRETTEEAVRRGAFGAPSIFVGQELYFGQDRLDFVEAALNA
ncbi:MAG: 2-hydroxychromene-2-carboxylate isomerase [Hyphomicrobiales bacterium]|nr:2-hydroxychromene-2-carboxylate isomerase [Hyphomicrobiales bacterium]